MIKNREFRCILGDTYPAFNKRSEFSGPGQVHPIELDNKYYNCPLILSCGIFLVNRTYNRNAALLFTISET
jgi:hypothetical protein